MPAVARLEAWRGIGQSCFSVGRNYFSGMSLMSIDSLIVRFDNILRTVAAPAVSARPIPGAELPESAMTETECRHVVGLMRVNHSGEVCAQALYQGQSITSGSPELRVELERAAREETEHLAWTELRISELGGRKSLLNPFWYAGALALGAFAGSCGDRWNLGFLAETERQVGAHLDDHLGRLPAADAKSRAIITQMRSDELSHAETAVRLGGHALPLPVRFAMKAASRVMTSVAYFV